MNTYNVKTEGAKGDGTSNDAPAIQQAIDKAVNDKGGTVFFPPGKYLIENTLNVNGMITLRGSGWSTNNTDEGSFIFFKSDFSGNAMLVSGRAATIEQLGFVCDQPTIGPNWQPNEFGGAFALRLKADDITVRNVFLYNVTRGIDMSGDDHSIGRITLNRIFGQPLKTGIKIDNALDVIKVNNVHFWPFWSGNDAVKQYQINNAIGLVSYRNDNPFYSNIFCLHYKIGMRFLKSTDPGSVDPAIWGHTSKFKLVNADMDICAIGVQIEGDDTTGHITNLSTQGTDVGDFNEAGIKMDGKDVKLQISNARISNYNNNGIRIGGINSSALIDNIWVQDWNRNENSFPAIEVLASNECYIGATRFFTGGNGSLHLGGEGTIRYAKLETL